MMSLGPYWVARPLFLLAVLGVSLLGLYDWWAGGLWVLLFGVVGFGWVSGQFRLCALFITFGVVVVGRVHYGDLRQAADERRFGEVGGAYVEGRLVEDGSGGEGYWSAVVRLHGEKYGGVKVHWVGVGRQLPSGTEVSGYGVFEGFEGARNPGELELAGLFRREGVVAVFRASEMRTRYWTGPVSGWLARVKGKFREGIVAGLDDGGESSQVIRAVVLGERGDASLSLVRCFRESGTLHVFTVSGMHVLMLGSMVWLVLKWCGVGRAWAIPVIVFGMFFYAWLAGNGQAALRAAWMGSVFLVAFLLRRKSDMLNALGAVLVVNLVLNPQMVRMPGVQLSYGVVAAIGLIRRYTVHFFSWISGREELLPSREMGWLRWRWYCFRQGLVSALSTSSAAWLGSLFLSAYHFGIVTPVSVVASVVLGFQVYAVLGVALVSALVFPVSEVVAVSLNSVNSVVAGSCSTMARFFSDLPGAWMEVGRAKGDSLIVYDLDYGAGAGCFVSSAGSAVMIDVGGEYALEAVVGRSLKNLRVRPDSFFFTHEDAGHAVGPDLLNQMFPIRQVGLVSPERRGAALAGWDDFPKGDLRVKNLRVFRPAIGDVFELGEGAWAEVLLSPVNERLGALADDRVVVFKIHWRGWRILWLGDAGRMSEEALLLSGVDLSSDLIVAGMHDGDLSLTGPFLDAVNPQAILIPRIGQSPMGEFRKQQKVKWEKARRGMAVVDQLEAGGVTIRLRGEELVLDGFLDDSRCVLERR